MECARELRERGENVWVVAVEDERAGARLVPVVEGELESWDVFVDEFNAGRPGFERLSKPLAVPELPRTALGKPDLQALRDLVAESGRS